MSAKPVIVGVDGSPASLRAAALGAQVADATGAECRLVHAVPDLWKIGVGGRIPTQQLRHEARRRLEGLLREVVPPEVLARLLVRVGRPPAILAQEVRRCRASLVVLGGKPHGALARRAGGSTAQHLVRTAGAPLLVTGPSTRPIQRVLVAVDLSRAASPTLRSAVRFAELFGARLRALHVIEPIKFPTVVPLAPDDVAFARASEAEFERVLARARMPAVTERAVRRGTAPDAIADEATEWGAELVVVGSHGRGWVDRLLIGSTTEAVLGHLPAAVLVVPAASRAAARKPATRRAVPRYVI